MKERYKQFSLPPLQSNSKKKRTYTEDSVSLKRSSLVNIHENLARSRMLAKLYLQAERKPIKKTVIPQIKKKVSSRNQFNEKKYKKKLSFIIESLRQKSQEPEQETYVEQRKIKNHQKYNEVISAYSVFEQRGQPKSQSDVKEFLESLAKVNYFFQKISFIVTFSLFQVGKFKQIQPLQYLYHENDPHLTFFIVLWGQLKMKTKYNKKVQYLMSGDVVGEQIIFEEESLISIYKTIHLSKGLNPRRQNVQAITQCGFLEINLNQYHKIRSLLSEMGEKDNFYLAQKLMRWRSIKKKKFYK